MDYRDRWIEILKELNVFSPQTLKRVVKDLYGNTFISGERYFVPVDSHLAIILRRGRHPSIEILRKETDSSVYSLVYSSTRSPLELLDSLSTKIKDAVTTKLREVKEKSRTVEKLEKLLNQRRSRTGFLNLNYLSLQFSEDSLFFNSLEDILKNFNTRYVARMMGYSSKSPGNVLNKVLKKKSVGYLYLRRFVEWVTNEQDSYFERFRGYSLMDFVMDCEYVFHGPTRISRGRLFMLVEYDSKGTLATIDLKDSS
jgi:hypothetical protein